MLLSLALILIFGIILGKLFEKLHLTKIMGMILTGFALGPFFLNLIDVSVLDISSELREIALVIILARAGLGLNINELKKVGRPAILMCFVPAFFEILAIMLLAPLLLGLNLLESAILGTVIAAVSPAVVVPRMLKLINQKKGTEKSIPQMIMASASVDDVIVIVLFTALTAYASSSDLSLNVLLAVPISLILGVIIGVICGLALNFLFTKIHMQDTLKVAIMMSVFFVLVTVDTVFSGILAVMLSGVSLNYKNKVVSKRLSSKFSKMWVIAEVFLFVLVGATLDLSYVLSEGIFAVILVLVSMLNRMIGVFVSLVKTNFNFKEKLFTAFSYMPKATVQAAIGAIPLSMGLACGNTVLTCAIIAILVTAPLGAGLIDNNNHLIE